MINGGVFKRIVTVTITGMCVFAAYVYAEPSRQDVLRAMKKASDFMANTVSYRGGYVYKYSADLSRRWGEIPARETQAWCQPPGTPAVGRIFLEAYQETGEEIFLDYAKQVADALVWGQHPAGGWHYMFDFDMTGIREWYDEVASKCWGWEEYYHYYGNCTFDDEGTYAPAQFLLDLYCETLDPAYRDPLIKALDFVVEAQYPNGGWPQRYPLMYDYPHGGHDDYTHYYTYNDGVAANNIKLLFDAWEKLGIKAYRDAAISGMDFYIVSQLPYPQSGWAQQYTMDMRPGWARTYEPAALSVHRTITNINDLMRFYTMTGYRRYLDPIPNAIDWLERSAITNDPSLNYTHAGFYEFGTDKPLYYHFEGTDPENHRSVVNHEREGAWWYRKSARPDIEGFRDKYKRVSALSPEEAIQEYESAKVTSSPQVPDADTVEKIVKAMDSRGAWVTEIGVRQFDKGMLDVPLETLQGIDVQVFIKNLGTLTAYAVSRNK